jgi:hypothetical protein
MSTRPEVGRRRAEGAPGPSSRPAHLRLANWVSAGAFTVGGSLFALGAAVAQVGSGDAATAASIYLVGGIFFSTGAYASLLGEVNRLRDRDAQETLTAGPWRWWSYEPASIDWLSAFTLFLGTLAFGISLVDAFISGLSVHGVDRLIWRPEIAGCVLFLVSGHLAMTGICGRARPCLRRRDLGWAVVAINQLGSILFMISAVAAFTRPETMNEVNVGIANWGTLTGALCFAFGGVLQAFERSPDGGEPLSG